MADSPAQPKLTTKQRLFVEYFLGECEYNASAAARKAGYKSPYVEGARLLASANIQAYIDTIFADVGHTRSIAIGMVLQDATRTDADILAVAARAPSIPATASVASSLISARTTARTHLAKAHGLLADRLNVKHSGRVDHVVRVPQQLHNLSDDELDALERIAIKAQDAEHEVTA